MAYEQWHQLLTSAASGANQRAGWYETVSAPLAAAAVFGVAQCQGWCTVRVGTVSGVVQCYSPRVPGPPLLVEIPSGNRGPCK
jgi:hypothetical protein